MSQDEKISRRRFSLVKFTNQHMTRDKLFLPSNTIHYYPSESSVVWTDQHEIKRVSGTCLRSAYLRATGAVKPTKHSAYTEWVFALGKAVEIILVEQWKQAGIWVGNNIKFYNPEYNISGELDCVLIDPETKKLMCVECCSPDTLILLNDGKLIPIKDISYDNVLWTESRKGIPIHIFSRQYSGMMYKFHHKADGLDGWFTSEHPILTANVRMSRYKHYGKERTYHREGIQFKKAGEIQRGDYISIPKIDLSELSYEDLHYYENLTKNGDWNYKIVDNQVIPTDERGSSSAHIIPAVINDMTEFYWLLGLYAAEGSCSAGGVYFSLSREEQTVIEHIRYAVDKIFGLEISVRKLKDSKTGEEAGGINVSISSVALRNLFKSIISGNTHDRTKYVDYSLISDKQELLLSFLHGAWTGDGCNADIFQRRVVSAVPQLALFYFQIAMRCGLSPRLKKYQQMSQFNSEWIYSIEWADGGSKKNIEKPIETEDYWHYKIKKVETKDYHGMVYNLETIPDHTYVAAGLITHNCKSFYGYYATKEIMGSRDQAARPKTSHLLQAIIYLHTTRSLISYAKLFYAARDSGNRNEFDVEIDPDSIPGSTYVTVNGVREHRFTIEDIYSRYKTLDHYVKNMILPPKDYEEVWDRKKVEERQRLGEVAKTAYGKWQKDPKKNPIGDWQCSYCQYTKFCQEHP